MIVARTTELAEDLLAAWTLRCPRCNGPELTAWGYRRECTVRPHAAGPVAVRPRLLDAGAGDRRSLGAAAPGWRWSDLKAWDREQQQRKLQR